jgi:hypothetical protein
MRIIKENEKFNRNIEIIRKNQIEILELKKIINEMKSSVESVKTVLVMKERFVNSKIEMSSVEKKQKHEKE